MHLLTFPSLKWDKNQIFGSLQFNLDYQGPGNPRILESNGAANKNIKTDILIFGLPAYGFPRSKES